MAKNNNQASQDHSPKSFFARPFMNYTLWTLQALLALLFIFGGVVKLMMSAAALAAQTGVPGWLMQFVSVAEIVGGLGLVLPGIRRLRLNPILTPLAALGLIIIMVGAIVDTTVTLGAAMAIMPFVFGLLLSLIAYGRRNIATR